MYNEERKNFGYNYACAINKYQNMKRELSNYASYIRYIENNNLQNEMKEDYLKYKDELNKITKKIDNIKEIFNELDTCLGADTFQRFEKISTIGRPVYDNECQKFFDKYNDLIEEKMKQSQKDNFIDDKTERVLRVGYTYKLKKLDRACQILEELFEVKMPIKNVINEELNMVKPVKVPGQRSI